MTAEEIIDLGDEVRWSEQYATKVLRAHKCDLVGYLTDTGLSVGTTYDAASILEWLGY